MRIDGIHSYRQKLVGQPSKEQAAPGSAAAKPSPPGEMAMERRLRQLETLQKAVGQMKDERAAMKQAEENGKAQQEGIKVLLTCMEISRRIISGDKVPREDHAYLMKHDMELYARSIMMRRIKEDPEEHDRLSEEEEPSDGAKSTAGSDAAASGGGARSGGSESSGSAEAPAPAPSLDVSV